MRIAVWLVPRAGADRIDGVVDGELRCRVTAPPVDGAANAALEHVMAAALGVAKTKVRIVGGASNRRKLVEIDGVDAAALRARWPGLDV